VKRTPPFLPVVGYRLADHLTEQRTQRPVSVGSDVGGELDGRATVDFLDAVGNELEHACARVLGDLGRDGDGDAVEPARQRKALLSFSKKPSSAR
jgi:hypothetical protein